MHIIKNFIWQKLVENKFVAFSSISALISTHTHMRTKSFMLLFLKQGKFKEEGEKDKNLGLSVTQV